jgi:hypothetical protein
LIKENLKIEKLKTTFFMIISIKEKKKIEMMEIIIAV